jgi:RecA-family ATPase
MEDFEAIPYMSDEDQKKDSDDMEFICAATLYQKPPELRKWHVPELIPEGAVTTMSGDGGVGKSLVALQLAVATALGRDWLGHQTRKGGVLYVSAEDDIDELHRRLSGIGGHYQSTIDELGDLTLLSLVGKDAILSVAGSNGREMCTTPLFDRIEKWICEKKPILFVIDTLADVFGGDEINRSHARQFISQLRSLCVKMGATILLLAHPSQAGKTRGDGLSGSTAWNNSVRSRINLTCPTAEEARGDRNIRFLEGIKSNYGPTGIKMRLRYKDGVFLLDGFVSAQEEAECAEKAEFVFMKLLRSYVSKGMKVNFSGGSNYAPSMFARDPGCEGLSRKCLALAMSSLLAQGQIRNIQEGPKSRPTTRLVPTT